MDNNVNNENQKKHEKKGKNTTAILIIIIMILLLVLGIVAGMFISKNMNSDSKQNEATSSSSSKKAENDENNKEQNIKEDDENNQEKNNDEETDEKQNNNEKQDNNKEYSQADLEKMALDYYEAKTGYRPTKSGSQVNDDGTVSIQLYDNMGDHNSTSDWYTVDPKTGIGTDLLNEKIDLTTKPKKDINTQNNSQNSNNSNNYNNVAAEEIRKCLKDKNWVQNNIMMKNTVFGDPIEHEQELTFIKVNGGNYSPMIVIEACSEEDLSVQYFVVTYQNGKVISHPFSEYPFHMSHAGISVDANNAMAVQGYMHMGYNVSTYYDIKEGKPRTLDIIGNYDDYGDDGYTGNIIYFNGDDTNKISESQYNEIAQKYKKYKFVSIGTKLTDANIDEYVK